MVQLKYRCLLSTSGPLLFLWPLQGKAIFLYPEEKEESHISLSLSPSLSLSLALSLSLRGPSLTPSLSLSLRGPSLTLPLSYSLSLFVFLTFLSLIGQECSLIQGHILRVPVILQLLRLSLA